MKMKMKMKMRACLLTLLFISHSSYAAIWGDPPPVAAACVLISDYLVESDLAPEDSYDKLGVILSELKADYAYIYSDTVLFQGEDVPTDIYSIRLEINTKKISKFITKAKIYNCKNTGELP
jgi:hypothetical protein